MTANKYNNRNIKYPGSIKLSLTRSIEGEYSSNYVLYLWEKTLFE